MGRVIKLGTGVLMLLCLVGCIQVDTVVKLKPDGTGTIEETVLMSKEFVKQMEMMVTQMATELGAEEKEGETAKGFDMFNEDELKEKASALGEGVTYVSGKKVVTGEAEGFHATYAFTDINKLKLNQNPSDKAPSEAGGPGPGAKGETQELIRFQFTKGSPATLVVKMPSQKPAAKPAVSEKPEPEEDEGMEEQDAAAMEMMKQMFKGMKIAIAIEVEGSIVETNATHREGSRVTLMEIDFGKLIEDAEKFKKFAEREPETIEEVKSLMKDLPGIKVELNEQVMIKFK